MEYIKNETFGRLYKNLKKQETQTLDDLMQSLWQNFPHYLQITKALTLHAWNFVLFQESEF